MTPNQPEAPEYPVGIPYRQLRQPPDLSAVKAIDPDASAIVQLSCTEAQFAALCDGDIRDYLLLETHVQEPYSWHIRVGYEEGLAWENFRSPQERCMRAWLAVNRPDWSGNHDSILQLALSKEDLTAATLLFLLEFYDLLGNPWEYEDDNFFLQQMQEQNVRYEDFALLPASPNSSG